MHRANNVDWESQIVKQGAPLASCCGWSWRDLRRRLIACWNKLEITPVSGEELTKIAKEVIEQPPEVVERIKKILAQ